MGLFDLEEEDTIINDNNGKMSVRASSYKKIAKIDNRNEYFNENVLQMPSMHECLCIKTNGLSDTGSIFNHIINNHKCNELYLSTWIISRENIDMIINALKSGKLNKVYFVISVRLKQLKKSNYAHLIEQFTEHKDKCFFKVCNSHAKIFSLSTDKDYFTVIGSGNWTQNPRIENYIIHNDINIFDFNKDWITELTCPKQLKLN